MGSVKFKDLKAFVRYDGSGRVVAGSLVFRKKKPKNGRWSEISSNLCCNPGGNTTTTTTTGGGGTTPTAWIVTLYSNEQNACANMFSGTIVGYTESATVTIGTNLWADAALTIPLNTSNNNYIKLGGDSNIYVISSMSLTFISGIVSCTTTTTTTQSLTYFNADLQSNGTAAVCSGTGQFNIPFIMEGDVCGGSGIIILASGTWGTYGVSNGSNIYVNLANIGLPTVTLAMSVFGDTLFFNNGCINC